MGKLSTNDLRNIILNVGYENIIHAVETGTYTGDSAETLNEIFDNVHSIELSQHFHTKALARFIKKDLISEDGPGITLHLGDSADLLLKIIQHIHAPILFYLDAHWWDASAKEDRKYLASSSPMPIWSEIEAINAHPYDDIVIINNIRAFGGKTATSEINDMWIDINKKNLKTQIDNVVKHEVIKNSFVIYTKVTQ